MRYSALKYAVAGRIARITLNRPARLNAIDEKMPREIRRAVDAANEDDRVHVIVLSGAGKAFCAGYDLKKYAEGSKDRRHGGAPNRWNQAMPWDPMRDYRGMKANTDDFFSIWRSYKPVICKVHGYAVAGGSDIALCADIVIMEDKARIGYMPARVWGCPTTAMWVYRLGAEKAKRMLLTGDTVDGTTAEKMGLVYQAVPLKDLNRTVDALAKRMAGVPKNQLMMQKLMINQAYENMGLAGTQMMATLFDGIARHSPEGVWFKNYAEKHGFHAAVKWRDSGKAIPRGKAVP